MALKLASNQKLPFYILYKTIFKKPILYNNIVNLRHKSYTEKAPSLFNKDEVNMLKKTNLPPNIIVTEASNIEKNQAADSFYSTSIFYDETVCKFVNCMMKDGKKAVSQKVMHDTFLAIKKIQLEKYHKSIDSSNVELDPLKIFHGAIENVKPVLGTQNIKKKGKSFKVPYPLPLNRRRFLANKWLLESAKKLPGNNVRMSQKLSKTILDAYRNEGSAVQKKIEFHKQAEANRALAHYRWW
ncbi:small ribosomal subunit protein uS7m [Hydra vulgaris]|uniref:small ribosomal subunit protein uS7m n=1 Tax=Hydra vulgaris TaxID=6087 RepID=UPI000192402D|nr:28S ribosomal protein S7, mitochondrial [Hydra vulgaris]